MKEIPYYKICAPYKAKTIDAIKLLPKEKRIEKIEEAGYNCLLLKSKDVFIDLFTDSGTSALSSQQWAGMMQSDEAYAGAESFYRLEEAVQDIYGYKYVLPAHMGRAAQSILYSVIIEKDKIALSNTFYGGDIAESYGGKTINLAVEECYNSQSDYPFKGNINIDLLKKVIEKVDPRKISAMVPVLTNNLAGGHPLSLENLRRVREICNKNNIPLYLDACRVVENAFLIKELEEGYKDKSVKSIVKEICNYSDGCIVSGKKDGLSNTGGFVATNKKEVYDAALPVLLRQEGFTTFGGMTGRDMESLAIGLYEAIDEQYLLYRVGQVRKLAEELDRIGVPVVRPYSGSTIYLDAKRFLEHINYKNLRAETISAALYIEGGIRTSPFGQLMSGYKTTSDDLFDSELKFLKRKGVFALRENIGGEEVEAELQLVRLCIPRRVYFDSHLEVVKEVVYSVFKDRENFNGLEITYQPKYYRFFSARMRPKDNYFWKK